MAEPWLGLLTKQTEFFSTQQIGTNARRTGFVRRASVVRCFGLVIYHRG
jgi:hypothetical protein